MTWIETVGEEPEPQGELGALYARTRDPHSKRVDNIMAVHSLHPAGLAAHDVLYRAVMRGTPTLRKVDRELIAFVVSDLNACHY